MATSAISPEDLSTITHCIYELAIQDRGPICRDARSLLRAKEFGDKCSKGARHRVGKFLDSLANTPEEEFRKDSHGCLIAGHDGTGTRRRHAA